MPAGPDAGARRAGDPSRGDRVALAVVALSLIGLAVAGYLTYEHFTTATTLACPETGVVNCQKVTTSPQSAVLGIPVALLGLAYFAGMLLLGLPAVWRLPNPLLRRARLALAVVGAVFVIYLVYVELFVVDAICLWCTAVHVLALALFALVALASSDRISSDRNPSRMS